MGKRINVMAVTMGFFIDVIGTVVCGVVIGLVTAIPFIAKGHSVHAYGQYYVSNGWLMLASLAIGLIFVAVGGFIAGKIAKSDEVLNACTEGVLAIALGLLLWWTVPLWYNLAGLVLTLPASYLGGILARRSNHTQP